MNRQRTGEHGEDLAAEFLEGLGMRVLETNYRFERSEVDLVCFDEKRDHVFGGEIVFVEVKTRTGRGYGQPEDAVTPDKQQRIVGAARAYLYETKLEGAACRFDVVSIHLDEQPPRIRHFRDAFVAG